MSFNVVRQDFTSTELRLLEDLTVPNYYKTYKIMYRLGWKNSEMRAEMASGYKPWRTFPITDGWLMDDVYCRPGPENLPLSEARYEWLQWFEFWWSQVQNADNFEIFDTRNIGLGIRTVRSCSFQSMAEELQGFLHVIPYPLFAFLKSHR